MKIAILSHADVAGYYAANLTQRGHQITISGHAPGLKPYLECDGCLLLGDEDDLREIADYMEASGKMTQGKLCRPLADRFATAKPCGALRFSRCAVQHRTSCPSCGGH
jgi:NADPH-dependent ferric siderophore reductase